MYNSKQNFIHSNIFYAFDGFNQKNKLLNERSCFLWYFTGLMFTMKRLCTNPTLIFLSLAGSAETATIGIFAAFSVIYLQTQFGLSPGTSGMLVGEYTSMHQRCRCRLVTGVISLNCPVTRSCNFSVIRSMAITLIGGSSYRSWAMTLVVFKKCMHCIALIFFKKIL